MREEWLRGERGENGGECEGGGRGWISLYLSGEIHVLSERNLFTVQTYLTWLALLYVEVGWCGGSVENVLGAGVDLGAGRSKAEVGG